MVYLSSNNQQKTVSYNAAGQPVQTLQQQPVRVTAGSGNSAQNPIITGANNVLQSIAYHSDYNEAAVDKAKQSYNTDRMAKLYVDTNYLLDAVQSSNRYVDKTNPVTNTLYHVGVGAVNAVSSIPATLYGITQTGKLPSNDAGSKEIINEVIPNIVTQATSKPGDFIPEMIGSLGVGLIAGNAIGGLTRKTGGGGKISSGTTKTPPGYKPVVRPTVRELSATPKTTSTLLSTEKSQINTTIKPNTIAGNAIKGQISNTLSASNIDVINSPITRKALSIQPKNALNAGKASEIPGNINPVGEINLNTIQGSRLLSGNSQINQATGYTIRGTKDIYGSRTLYPKETDIARVQRDINSGNLSKKDRVYLDNRRQNRLPTTSDAEALYNRRETLRSYETLEKNRQTKKTKTENKPYGYDSNGKPLTKEEWFKQSDELAEYYRELQLVNRENNLIIWETQNGPADLPTKIRILGSESRKSKPYGYDGKGKQLTREEWVKQSDESSEYYRNQQLENRKRNLELWEKKNGKADAATRRRILGSESRKSKPYGYDSRGNPLTKEEWNRISDELAEYYRKQQTSNRKNNLIIWETQNGPADLPTKIAILGDLEFEGRPVRVTPAPVRQTAPKRTAKQTKPTGGISSSGRSSGGMMFAERAETKAQQPKAQVVIDVKPVEIQKPAQIGNSKTQTTKRKVKGTAKTNAAIPVIVATTGAITSRKQTRRPATVQTATLPKQITSTGNTQTETGKPSVSNSISNVVTAPISKTNESTDSNTKRRSATIKLTIPAVVTLSAQTKAQAQQPKQEKTQTRKVVVLPKTAPKKRLAVRPRLKRTKSKYTTGKYAKKGRKYVQIENFIPWLDDEEDYPTKWYMKDAPKKAGNKTYTAAARKYNSMRKALVKTAKTGKTAKIRQTAARKLKALYKAVRTAAKQKK